MSVRPRTKNANDKICRHVNPIYSIYLRILRRKRSMPLQAAISTMRIRLPRCRPRRRDFEISFSFSLSLPSPSFPPAVTIPLHPLPLPGLLRPSPSGDKSTGISLFRTISSLPSSSPRLLLGIGFMICLPLPPSPLLPTRPLPAPAFGVRSAGCLGNE